MFSSLVGLCSLLALSASASAQTDCSSSAIPKPYVFGGEVTAFVATPISNFGNIPGNDVCFVNVTLTHPGTGDNVHHYVGLPLSGWNGIFQGIGGGGWAAGNPPQVYAQNSLGYAAAATDAGHDLTVAASYTSDSWALVSPGNVDQYALLNFARRSLYDLTVIGKAVTESYYGKKIKKSYWNGCSTGGRQGLMFAQYYPDAYDGILANAPAIQWTDLNVYGAYLWSVLTNENYFPPACEIQAVVEAVTSACDDLDGVHDGLIGAPGLCHFNGQTLVGKSFTCATDGTRGTFTQKTADVVNKIWQGPHTPEGQFLWYGLIRGANFSALYTDKTSGAQTTTPVSFGISDSWVQLYLKKDPSYNLNNISYAEYPSLFLQSHIEYDSIMGTASPDLRPFKKRGGKLITWQGLADELIPPQGTILYYEKILGLDPSANDFYRLFFTPGVGHCAGGLGPIPLDPLGQLRAWVENGTAPETLKAASPYPLNSKTSDPINGTNVRFLDLCPYPAVSKYKGRGSPLLASSYVCAPERGWLDFVGPNGRTYCYPNGPGWYGGDTS